MLFIFFEKQQIKKILNTLVGIQRSFLWSGCDNLHKIAWISWDKICQPKNCQPNNITIWQDGKILLDICIKYIYTLNVLLSSIFFLDKLKILLKKNKRTWAQVMSNFRYKREREQSG